MLEYKKYHIHNIIYTKSLKKNIKYKNVHFKYENILKNKLFQ